MCRSVSKQGMKAVQKMRLIHKMQQRDEASWHNAHDENNRHVDVVNIKCFSFNSTRLVSITKLETSSR